MPRFSMKPPGVWLFFAMIAGAGTGAWAYPEFQIYSEDRSGRSVNCAMCHTHADGPEGLKHGQIGRLTPEELEQLGQARAAFEPGSDVESPVLNEFGNLILQQLGKREILLLRQDPGALADALGYESDLDGDGIPDAQEYLDGTHPLDPHHGDPWQLFKNNLVRYRFHVFMIVLATALGLYGLNNILHWLERVSRIPGDGGETKE